MTALDLAMLLAIDQRVSVGRERITALGTVASRSLDTNITVTMDGSAFAVPCKIFGDVEAYEGDRVGLVKFGLWWTVVGSFTKRWPAKAGATTVQSSGTTTSSTFGDIPTPADVVIVKRWNTTRLRLMVAAGSYCSATPCEAEWGVRLTGTAFAATNYAIINTPYTGASAREVVSGWDYISGLAPDTYTARVMWRRKSGTGTVTTDSSESVALDVEEVSP